jgi:hypothetical protein
MEKMAETIGIANSKFKNVHVEPILKPLQAQGI